jgi:oligoendopeptidase F
MVQAVAQVLLFNFSNLLMRVESVTIQLNGADTDAKWAELWRQFMPGIDYSGLDEIEATGWHRKLHIFQVPFYYVEYGLAQIGAYQVWRNSQKDLAGAVTAYRAGLALGSRVGLPELFAVDRGHVSVFSTAEKSANNRNVQNPKTINNQNFVMGSFFCSERGMY